MAEIENLEKFNATILSTTRSMLKMANTEKQKEAIIKRTVQAQEKELKAQVLSKPKSQKDPS